MLDQDFNPIIIHFGDAKLDENKFNKDFKGLGILLAKLISSGKFHNNRYDNKKKTNNQRNFLKNKYAIEDKRKISNCLKMQGIEVSEEFEEFFEILVKSESELKIDDLIKNNWLKEAIDNKIEIEENLKIEFEKIYNLILKSQELDIYNIDLTNTVGVNDQNMNPKNLLVDSIKNKDLDAFDIKEENNIKRFDKIEKIKKYDTEVDNNQILNEDLIFRNKESKKIIANLNEKRNEFESRGLENEKEKVKRLKEEENISLNGLMEENNLEREYSEMTMENREIEIKRQKIENPLKEDKEQFKRELKTIKTVEKKQEQNLNISREEEQNQNIQHELNLKELEMEKEKMEEQNLLENKDSFLDSFDFIENFKDSFNFLRFENEFKINNISNIRNSNIKEIKEKINKKNSKDKLIIKKIKYKPNGMLFNFIEINILGNYNLCYEFLNKYLLKLKKEIKIFYKQEEYDNITINKKKLKLRLSIQENNIHKNDKKDIFNNIYIDNDLEDESLPLIFEIEIVELIDKNMENNLKKFYLMFNHIKGNIENYYDYLKEIKNISKDLIKKFKI